MTMPTLVQIKAFFVKFWEYLAFALAAAVAILLYALNLRNKELEAAQDRIALAKTQKDADLIEADLKQRLAQEDLAQKDRDALQQSLDLLNQKRQSLSDPRTTDDQKADYWNNQK